jgi:pimeloyl-ACP methyl ester carboxylesterase
MTEPKTDTLHVPGAVLHYDIRSTDSSTHPVLLIIGSPMGADVFVTLAGHFADRTVVTYDHRGSGRSQRTDGALETTPDEHADDLHRLISALDAGPVDIFASGGAVNALALVAKHPEQVRDARGTRATRLPGTACRSQEDRSWIKTTPFTTIGFAAREPYGVTPAAAGPVMWNVRPA